MTPKWIPRALIQVYNKARNANRNTNTSTGALAHVGAPRGCSRDATAPLTPSWFGSLPDTAKDSMSCRSCPATAIFSGGGGCPAQSWRGQDASLDGWQSDIHGAHCSRGMGHEHRREEGWTCLPPQRGSRLKCSACPSVPTLFWPDTCRGLPGALALHCNSSWAGEDGFPRQGVQIEMPPALPKASIKVPLLPSEVLITRVLAAVR